MVELRRAPLWPIVERHFEEAEFLAEQWLDAHDEPDHSLESLAEGPEARLLAHLDGLEIAGPPALERLCWPALDDGDADRSLALVAASSVLAVAEAEGCSRLLALLDGCEAGDPRWAGIVEALSLSPRAGLESWLLDQLDASRATVGPRVAGLLETLGRRRVGLGERLTALLQSEDPAVLRPALILARRGTSAQLQLAAAHDRHGDPEVVAAALETGLVRGLPGAWPAARYWAFEGQRCSFRGRALSWLALGEDAGDHRRILGLLEDPELRAEALWAAGFCGRVEAVDTAMAWLEDEAVGPLAGELITAIAGLPVDDETLWREPSPPSADETLPALAADELSEDLELRPEELLPIPEPGAVAAWWRERRSELPGDTRLIAGRRLDDAELARALGAQPLRRRHLLGLLVQLRSQGASWPRTRTWAHEQLRVG